MQFSGPLSSRARALHAVLCPSPDTEFPTQVGQAIMGQAFALMVFKVLNVQICFLDLFS